MINKYFDYCVLSNKTELSKDHLLYCFSIIIHSLISSSSRQQHFIPLILDVAPVFDYSIIKVIMSNEGPPQRGWLVFSYEFNPNLPQSFWKLTLGRLFVNMSAIWSSVEMYSKTTWSDLVLSLILSHGIWMYLFVAMKLLTVNALFFSSWITIGLSTFIPIELNSSFNYKISWRDSWIAKYSASVVERGVSFCRFVFQ